MEMTNRNLNALRIGAAAAFLAGCGSSQLPVANSARGAIPLGFTHHVTFNFTGKKQTFKVPANVTRLRVIATGANGTGNTTAYGGRVSAVIAVTPSETLAIYVGGTATSFTGGFNGGGGGGPVTTGSGSKGSTGYGGGGASDVREGGNALSDRVIVAGGGGGQGGGDFTYSKLYGGPGGRGGARTGGAGKPGGCCKGYFNFGGGGTGGTQAQGGSGGKGADDHSGASGKLGAGGAGGPGCDSASCGYNGYGGGGGGGGLYGGGGGGGGIFTGGGDAGGGGGGGGGSSYAESTATDVHMWRGWKQDQAGMVVVYW